MAQTPAAQPGNASSPWHAAYPPPSNQSPSAVTRATVLSWLQSATAAGPSVRRDFLLVDLRRADHEGGTIRGSLNLPAQSFFPSMATLYELLSAAGVGKVVFYCASSKGRGNRAAGWFEDYIGERGDAWMESLVLEGGIKGWVGAGGEYVAFVDEYVEGVWGLE